MNTQPIGVMGCLPKLPDSFPIYTPENSGNMVHANAPLLMYPNSIYSSDAHIKLSGQGSFRPFVNNSCSHLIVTLANMLILGREDGTAYARFQKSLEQYNKPIVVFGLGVQANGYDLENATLPPEAIELVQFLSSRASLLGVRGEYTKNVVEKLAGVKNAYVTGCPSLYSRPGMLEDLYRNSKNGIRFGRPAVNVTNLQRPIERVLLGRAIRAEHYLVEPVSRAFHDYFIRISSRENMEVPYSMKPLKREFPDLFSEKSTIPDYFMKYYRLFRSLDSWTQFNMEHVSFTYGTRFHANMSSILSGVPALWLTHDARTRELVEFANLPSMALEDIGQIEPEDIHKAIDFEPFFDSIGGKFESFNYYLTENGLPSIKAPFKSVLTNVSGV
ncbi:polysaccharide pyruvyl transferase family protein [Specibacter sp. NPDC078709]|uniref:polysaccharide pyruvyl transferase family protein n=1 Tax=Specibacter sp. NPDC078709 TaxID=3154364 RepID=UPI0034327BB0